MLLSLDVETSTFASGNPYSIGNELVSVHTYCEGRANSFRADNLGEVEKLLLKTTLLIVFNGKFDLAWLNKYKLSYTGKVYDVQLAHFYITNQQHTLPSLDDVAAFYGRAGKLDAVKEYWDRGVDTKDIPWEVLSEYGERDVALTYELYLCQQEHWKNNPMQKKLFSLACMDLLVLLEMEQNGLFFDQEKCYEKSQALQADIKQLTDELSSLYPNIPINFNSNDQLSAFLYGGSIEETIKVLDGFYKTGVKKGQPKYKNETREHLLPRLFKPLPKTEMAKPGVFSTAEGTLQKLSGKNKPIVDKLLALAKLTKLDETYYKGLSKLNKEMNWAPNYLHGQFNQCIAKTGRLSSSKPNLQNLSGDSLDIFISRYD